MQAEQVSAPVAERVAVPLRQPLPRRGTGRHEARVVNPAAQQRLFRHAQTLRGLPDSLLRVQPPIFLLALLPEANVEAHREAAAEAAEDVPFLVIEIALKHRV